MALYASPSSVCSAPHPISSRASYDFDLSGRSTPSASATASPSRRTTGGLSSLLSAPGIKSASYSTGSDEVGPSLWHDRAEELGASSRYSLSSSLKRDQVHQSPVSVLSPISSCSSNSRSLPVKIGGNFNSIKSGNGLVSHAFRSCVDYDLSPLETKDSGLSYSDVTTTMDELTFEIEDCFLEQDIPLYAKDLLSDAQSRHLIFKDDLIIKAFSEAEKAHRGQQRATGHPYLQHCVETAILLANIGANTTVVAAGLLHDTIDDSFVTYEHILQSFGAGVADLVEGVSKLSQLSQLAREYNTANKTVEADRLHTMFLAMADARAVLIKLADRLHNMMTLDALPLIKQRRFAKETSEIFVPLANRLGIFTWKEQLENLCFKHLNPEQYHALSSKLVKSFDEAVITSSIEKLEQALKTESIHYHCLSGRHKSLFSIYSKMLKKKLNVDEIHDIHGLRLILETEEDCYKALKVIQQLWHEVPERFKDYIVNPKQNGYQSLHTVVLCDDDVPLEIQIRTKKMHLQAEYGFAAHWRYKEGEYEHSSFVLQMVEWARWVITWQCEAMSKDRSSFGLVDSTKPPCSFPIHSEDCIFSCKPQCQHGPIFVIIIESDKMSVQEFSANASLTDLLEATVQCNSGYRFLLNYEPISDPKCKLKMGDVVEIRNNSIMDYREEIRRMYNKTSSGPLPSYRRGNQFNSSFNLKTFSYCT